MTLARAIAGTYSALVLGAVVAPALVLEHAGDRGGLGASDGADLIGASMAVGVPAAALAWRRMRPSAWRSGSRTDVGIAGLISFSVLAAAASALPTLVLHATTGLAALDADSGWAVPVVWALTQAAAVVAGEATHRGVLCWLGG
ncbi:hypothetical protein SAMN05660748_2790 [Blastococcus aggregatus]|uniref:Uncharacterized protein n=1 Tax=Blastococcus aggregatus TaxID=38502 RepID=A0A285V7G0_9ACTN|nr:hypothetical protein [Blastococcus aggregatus]SOC50052.1 hypothetical protein SAMN05660748_2790 [Blastococcus aggregatus]